MGTGFGKVLMEETLISASGSTLRLRAMAYISGATEIATKENGSNV